MRLELESTLLGPSGSHLAVSGIIDWSTIARFRARLSECVSPPRPDVVVDLSGLLSWSREAQVAVREATTEALLRGGRLVVIGLPAIPRWEARDSTLPILAAW